jgi:hypothetical protein
MLRPSVPITKLEDDDDEHDVDIISTMKIENVLGRRGKYLLFYTCFKDKQIPLSWYRLNGINGPLIEEIARSFFHTIIVATTKIHI